MKKHYYKDNSVSLKDLKILTTDKYWYPEEMRKVYSTSDKNLSMLMKEIPRKDEHLEE